jgi:L-rhamnose isomerase
MLREFEDKDKGFQRLAMQEEAKTLPMGAVYDYFNLINGVPVGEDYIAKVEQYEKDVTSKR